MEREKTIDEMRKNLKTFLVEYDPDTTVIPGLAAGDGVGFATGDNLDAICESIDYIKARMKEVSAKQTIMEFIDEFVNSEYSASIFGFVLSAYHGKDLTKEDCLDIAEHIGKAIERYKQ